MNFARSLPWLTMLVVLAGCPEPDGEPQIAPDIFAPLGEPLPAASEEQRATFERGREVAEHRFTPSEGLGPQINVTFCASCHERPVIGGSAPRYRDFYLIGAQLGDGSFVPGGRNGVLTSYGFHGAPSRPTEDEGTNVRAHRNAIPFFGTGLIAEIPEDAILIREDPEDEDGDGISGRANYDRGFVGRFGRKAQTVSIEAFIRGPLNNHLGITSDPLTEEQKARLPVPSASFEPDMMPRQAAAPEEPLTDDDDIPDPELAGEDLFDLVSFAMLTAAPRPSEPTEASLRGEALFGEVGCADCHVPALEGPRGLVPLYSDLLLHDMGAALADGIVQNLATGAEFRTQPLWGIAAVAPYLHDGRADTLREAILWHGGEARNSRKAFEALSENEQADVVAFLESLGGAEQKSPGLLPPESPIPEPGEPGAPLPLAGEAELEQFLAGRALFDRDMPLSKGLGPLFNGDSCRACHFDPVVGGAGPLGLNVMRHGTMSEDGTFEAPDYGTILHKLTTWDRPRFEHTSAHNIFEPRQTPTLLGLGLIDGIDPDDIVANEDPEDLDGDGVSGIAHILPDGRLGTMGWKAQVPSVREFVRDAMGAELGLTSPEEDAFTFGAFTDDDDVPDPELTSKEIDEVAFFISKLAPPQPKADVPGGLALFETVGCDACHIPELPGADGPVRLYSDLLLHDVAPLGTPGIDDGMGTGTNFRTPPLWGLSDTAPYMHDGGAETVEDAIMAHDGEAQAVRAAYESLSEAERTTLLDFLESL